MPVGECLLVNAEFSFHIFRGKQFFARQVGGIRRFPLLGGTDGLCNERKQFFRRGKYDGAAFNFHVMDLTIDDLDMSHDMLQSIPT